MATLLAVLLCTIAAPTVAAYSYNGQAAADYAYRNAYNDVPGSFVFEFGGDDYTNFVSHFLQAGGWREKHPSPINSGDYRGSDVWYYDYPNWRGYSHTWAVADRFYDFLTYSGRAYPVSVKYKKHLLQRGDVVQIDYKDKYGNYGHRDHSMIVTGKNGNDPLMSYHSTRKEDRTRKRSLTEIMESSPDARFLGWRIRGTYY